jgi:hypothetical protein
MVTSYSSAAFPSCENRLFVRPFLRAGKQRNEVFRGVRHLTPITVHPEHPATTPHPMSTHPNRTRMRTNHPMTARPNPSAMPCPNPGHPGVSRPRRNRHHFRLHRRRNFTRRRCFRRSHRIRRRCRHGSGGIRRWRWSHCHRWWGRGWFPHIDYSTFYAACQQAGSRNASEKQYRLFHTGKRIVTSLTVVFKICSLRNEKP